MTENGLAFNATLFYLNLTKIVMPVVNKSSRNAPKTIIKSTKNGGKTIPISRGKIRFFSIVEIFKFSKNIKVLILKQVQTCGLNLKVYILEL